MSGRAQRRAAGLCLDKRLPDGVGAKFRSIRICLKWYSLSQYCGATTEWQGHYQVRATARVALARSRWSLRFARENTIFGVCSADELTCKEKGRSPSKAADGVSVGT